MNISELESNFGNIVPEFSGTLEKVWDRKTGTSGAGKEWSVQGGIVAQNGGKVGVTFWGRGDLSGCVGKPVVLASRAGNTGKLSGVEVGRNKKGYLELVVQKWGSVTFAGKGTAPTTQAPRQAGVNGGAPVTGDDGIKAARRRMMQLANMFGMSRDAAVYIASKHGFDGMPEDVRTCSTSLFIQAVREGLDKAMPVTALGKEKAQPAQAPATPPPSSEGEQDDIPFDWQADSAPSEENEEPPF